MDEIEARLAALELAFLEIAADLEPRRLAAAIERIEEPEIMDDDERMIRAGAVALLRDAQGRFDMFQAGVFIPKP